MCCSAQCRCQLIWITLVFAAVSLFSIVCLLSSSCCMIRIWVALLPSPFLSLSVYCPFWFNLWGDHLIIVNKLQISHTFDTIFRPFCLQFQTNWIPNPVLDLCQYWSMAMRVWFAWQSRRGWRRVPVGWVTCIFLAGILRYPIFHAAYSIGLGWSCFTLALWAVATLSIFYAMPR